MPLSFDLILGSGDNADLGDTPLLIWLILSGIASLSVLHYVNLFIPLHPLVIEIVLYWQGITHPPLRAVFGALGYDFSDEFIEWVSLGITMSLTFANAVAVSAASEPSDLPPSTLGERLRHKFLVYGLIAYVMIWIWPFMFAFILWRAIHGGAREVAGARDRGLNDYANELERELRISRVSIVVFIMIFAWGIGLELAANALFPMTGKGA